jgi:hypothetical protein
LLVGVKGAASVFVEVDSMMTTLYLLAAVVGGTVLVCQFVLTVLGFGVESIEVDGPDVDHPGDAHHGHWLFGVLSFRTVTAFTAFFGLGGLAANANELGEIQTLGLALLAGSGAFYGVAWLMRQLTRLDDEGTVSPEDAIDRTATVYLRIPPGGQGKVLVTVGQQVLELSARSSVDRELRNGETVRITKLLGTDVVEVQPVEAAEALPPVQARA